VLEFPRWKVWLIAIVIALGVILSIPSLIAGTPVESAWRRKLSHIVTSTG
jgi:hypothetical protein